MNKLLQIPFIIAFSIFLIGCSLQNTTQVSPNNKNEDLQKQIKENINSKYCYKYKRIVNYAASYIEKEFEDGYFSKNDIVGAKAQLFLIESSSPTVFAKNINTANDSYNSNYELAKKNNCDLSEFSSNPLVKLKNSIKILEEKKDKK
ncbi:hypothetical protein [Arcobacter sp.]|uniref:hypothetical protein n=1 Tax=Arcobacter sp. TaxID=1872629 RepID=UPI003C75EE46